ncbi:uncharacterized protein KY384_000864 [Bacidia gigantensis]|uniref:uncharacterized protein n=1 Tax=Bacidia gigantensis TaxID=2732470 RepID=UPI001D03A8E1|nr:uncharacterized protein KY384_000864 [Bacidia gigantensis]KAG8534022.1 hypothetical protein KY384_000864 [Bacidia gigantensis]
MDSSWLQKPTKDTEKTETEARATPFANTRKLFAVDASGSTSGAPMEAEKHFVLGLSNLKEDVVCKWGHSCNIPQTIDSVPSSYFNGWDGTAPACILQQPAAVDAIQASDFWVLLTDGEIAARDVEQLTVLAEQQNITQIPVILLIVGPRRSEPRSESISVGISFFAGARDAMILYKDIYKKTIYLIDAKGAFQSLKGATDSDLTDWNKLPAFKSEQALKDELIAHNISFEADRSQRQQQGISLGPEWDAATDHAIVKIADLLDQAHISIENLRTLLQEEATNQLALACKIRGRLNDLRNLFIRHKQQEVVVRLEDRHGAGEIMRKLHGAPDPIQRAPLEDELRKAHTFNRATYQQLRDSPNEDAKRATEINRLIDRALRIISGFEKASYTADILDRKSNRARRAEVVSTADTDVKLAALDLGGDVQAFRGDCLICCGDDEIMSVALKKLDTVEENTSDFALNFPLAAAQSKRNTSIVSAQAICFQCALLLERSIYQEDIISVIPTLHYDGANRAYINHQLYLALTAGLATGVSGVVQLFLGILDATLETKTWCAKGSSSDPEALARRETLEWLLKDMLKNCSCRETFSETGQWVKYPKALKWAAEEFREAKFDSWIIQYPIAGFTQMMRWFEILDLSVDGELLTAIRHAKLMHFIISQIMSHLLKSDADERKWTQPFLALLYQSFNAPTVPTDLGQNSIVAAPDFWQRLPAALPDWSDVKSFLGLYNSGCDDHVVNRIQLITFYALFTQKAHTTPKTFFRITAPKEPLAHAALDTTTPNLPSAAVASVLLSIFTQEKRSDPAFILHDEGAMVPFTEKANALRERRAKHLTDVFRANKDFVSQTGLPENTIAPSPPTSSHNNLHISTARAWARLDARQRGMIIVAVDRADGGGDGGDGGDGGGKEREALENFVTNVMVEICATSRRGDVYDSRVEGHVRAVLPSFVEALKRASSRKGMEDVSGVAFEFVWTDNTILWKMVYELGLDS